MAYDGGYIAEGTSVLITADLFLMTRILALRVYGHSGSSIAARVVQIRVLE
jgi:hypothetical protein